MRSLNARLGSGLIIALLLVFAVQWLLVTLIIRHVTEEYIITRMTRDIEQLLADIAFKADGSPVLTPQPRGPYTRGPFTGHYFQISADGRFLRSESIWDQTLDTPRLAPGETLRQRLSGPLDQALLVLSKGYSKAGHAVTITVAEDMSDVESGIDTFEHLYLLFSLGLMLLLLLCQWWLVRRSLKALTASRLDLERVARGETEKLPEDVPLEIRPLVSEINLLLGLLARRLERTRTAIGNLAHKLRTPLSLLAQMGEDPAIAGQPRLQQRMKQQVDSMHQALERELGRARLAGDNKSGRRFLPQEDIGSLAAVLERLYADKGVAVDQDITSDTGWRMDREDMLELLGNLLDNACKWAEKRVRITVGADRSIVIEDDGPGCPREELQSLSRRGRRLDESVEGYGLGLSIADDIVGFYNGRMDFDRSPDLGGLRVSVRFPAA